MMITAPMTSGEHGNPAASAVARSMLIRHADPAIDAQGCLEVYAPFVEGSAVSFEDRTPTVREYAQRIERLTRTHAYLVADDGGHIAGFAYAGPYRAREAYRWTCETTVYLDPGYQRRGLGRALYLTLFSLLEARGYRSLVAAITVPNAASIGLHEACGFTTAGTLPHNGFKDGRWRDVAWLTRAIGPRDEPRPPATIGPPARLRAPIAFALGDPPVGEPRRRPPGSRPQRR